MLPNSPATSILKVDPMMPVSRRRRIRRTARTMMDFLKSRR